MTTGEVIALIKAFCGGSGGGGTGGGVLVVHEDANNTLDKTYNEIVSAPFAIVRVSSGGFTTVKKLDMFGFDSGEYGVQFNNDVYTTESENGYPALSLN